METGSASVQADLPEGVTTLEEAAARMVAVDARLAASDGVRYFNGLYLQVTRAVERQLGTGQIEDPGFFETLAVVFSNAYFRAVDGFVPESDATGSRAWAPLFAARFDRRVAPIQFAIAGMNAHINHDLPIAVRDACAMRGLAPEDGTAHHRDYLRLNATLEDVQGRAKRPLTPGLLGVIDRAFGRLDDTVAAFSVARARDAAWLHARALWALQSDADLTASYLLTLDRTVGLAGRGLLAPTLLGLARWSSAQHWLPRSAQLLLGAARESW